ncbi:MAG TPA: hypothetical protein PLF88_00475 [Opitutaceae bacterium]|nr:hypothetical protein [Opitutaceae bacterium]HRJ46244.1 hypothetical protein [Opitutaceae bacterium]
MDSAPSKPAQPTPLDWFFRALGFITMCLIAFTLPQFPAMELDASWRMAIGHFFMEGRQFGTEVVFTYGPLGWAMGKTYWGSHWGALIGWHVVQAVVFTAVVFWHAYRLTGYSRVFFFVFFFLLGLTYQDAMHQTIMAFAGLELIRRSHTPWRWSSLALIALLVVLSLVKFTNLLLGFFLVLMAGALGLWSTRRAAALVVPGVFLGLFILGWAACGQNPLNLPAYFISSWQISQGYQDAMGLSCPPGQLYRGLTVAGLVVAYLGLNFFTATDRIRNGALTIGALALLYLNWKHGYIRADGHQIGFYYAALMVIVGAPLLLEDSPVWRWLKQTLLVAAGLLAVISCDLVLPGLVRGTLDNAQRTVNQHTGFFLGANHGRAIYEGKWEAERNNYDLRKVRETVGRSSLDVLGFEQAIALYNRFNYQPRPIFQGYSAYTPYLARLNHDYYASDRAPEFVLFKLQTLDGRLAMMDDPHVLRLLVQRYTYLFSEQGFALWARKSGEFDASAFEPTPIREAKARLGEDISLEDLSDRNIWVEIDYRFNLLGKLRRFLFRPPLVNLRIIDDKGRESVHRLPQPIGRAGFMLNPVVDDMLSYMHAAGGNPPRRAARIRVETAAQNIDCLAKDVAVRFYSLPASDAGKDYFKSADRAKFHMFSEAPISYEALNPPNEDIIDQRAVMIMHAPSQMTFEVPAGATMLQGDFGFVTGAYTMGGRTNGAIFTVYWTDGAERIVLHERHLNPVANLNDRGLQHFSSKLPKGTGHVTMRIDPGEHGEYAFDWTGWTGIEFK